MMLQSGVELPDDKSKKEFAEKCTDPKFVAECLKRYQRWRRGEGEYEWRNDEEALPMPFCAKALSIVEDAAIGFMEKMSNAGTDD